MKKLIAEIRALETRMAGLSIKLDAAKSVAEIRAMQPEIDEVSQDLEFKRNKLYGMQMAQGGQEEEFRSEVKPGHHAQPVGQLNVLGTYGIDSQGANQNQRSENKMNFANEKEEMRSSQAYKEAFYAVAQGRSATPEQRAMVTTATGSAIIPTSTFQEVVQNVQKAAGLISLVRVLNIPGNLNVPKSDVGIPATWHTQGEEIQDSTVPPGSTPLTGFELAKLFSMSAATQAMSMTAFEAYLIDELTRCTRDALADVLFQGTGIGQPLSILGGFTWGATNSIVIDPGDAWTALAKGMALLPANFRQNAVWVMNSVMFYSYLSTQLDANGNPIFSKDLASGMPLSLMGKLVVLDDFCPDDTIIFGDPKYYFLNFSEPMSIERSSDAGFSKAVVMYRALAVVDGKPVAPAFVKITK